MPRLDLVCVGEPNVDTVMSARGESLHQGGPETNTASAFVKLGGVAGLVGRVGVDRYGKFAKSNLKKARIDFSHVREDSNPTCRVIVETSPEERHITMVKPFCLSERLNPDDLKYIKRGKGLFVRVRHPLFKKCLDGVKGTHLQVYASTHYYRGPPGGQPAYDLRKYKLRAIIGSEDEMMVLKKYCQLPKHVILVVTRGAKGSLAILNGKKITAPLPVKAVDPTGAGDAFAGGFVFADLQSLPLKTCLLYGNACGAITVQKIGAQQDISRKKVEKLILKQS